MDGAQYLVWSTDMGEDEDDGGFIKAYDHEEACKEYAKRSYDDEPYEWAMCVSAKGPYGEIKTYSIHPEPTIYFYAYEEKAPAIAIEARSGETAGLDPKDESAGLEETSPDASIPTTRAQEDR